MNILLLPGFMTDAHLWDDVLPALEAIAEVRPLDISAATSIAEMASLALASAPDRFVLVGFSMGGYVARELVRLAPDRVDGLVLIATSGRGDSSGQTRSKALSASLVDPQRFHGLSRGAITSSLHADRASDLLMIERVRAMSERVGGEVFVRHASSVRQSDLGQLDQIHCPTLVIAADGDQLRSVEESMELSDGIGGSAFALIEGSGHMVPIEAPDALIDIMLPWLQGLKQR